MKRGFLLNKKGSVGKESKHQHSKPIQQNNPSPAIISSSLDTTTINTTSNNDSHYLSTLSSTLEELRISTSASTQDDAISDLGLIYRDYHISGKRPTSVWMWEKDIDEAYPDSAKWQEVKAPLRRPYIIKERNPTVGLGIYAARDIAAGETIIRERPIIMLPQKHYPPQTLRRELYDEKLENALESLVERLDAEDQARVKSLMNCKPKEGCRPLSGIIRTNGIACRFLHSKATYTYSGICLETSRANHSCNPNADTAFDPRAMAVELRAMRNIKEGDEITITYAGVREPRAERQKLLQEGYGFTCTCSSCSLGPTASKEDDKERCLINEYLTAGNDSFNKLLRGTESIPEMIKLFKSAVDLIQKKGFDSELESPTTCLAYIYATLGDMDNFKIWATKAVNLQSLAVRDGYGFDPVMPIARWQKNPKGIPFWGRLANKGS